MAITGRRLRPLLLGAMTAITASPRDRTSPSRSLTAGKDLHVTHRQPLAAKLGRLLGQLRTPKAIDCGVPFASHALG